MNQRNSKRNNKINNKINNKRNNDIPAYPCLSLLILVLVSLLLDYLPFISMQYSGVAFPIGQRSDEASRQAGQQASKHAAFARDWEVVHLNSKLLLAKQKNQTGSLRFSTHYAKHKTERHEAKLCKGNDLSTRH